MRSFTYEEELIVPVSLFFFRQGGVILREVRLGFCRADLVVFRPDGAVIAVELKLADWKKALVQAQNYQLGSDFVYVVFPEKKRLLIEKKMKPRLLEKGIGLMFVDPVTQRVSEMIRPRRSEKNFGTMSLAELKRRRKMRKRSHKKFSSIH